jgi:hypothetical protein
MSSKSVCSVGVRLGAHVLRWTSAAGTSADASVEMSVLRSPWAKPVVRP